MAANNKNASQEKEVQVNEKELALLKANRALMQASARKKELIRHYKAEDKIITYVSPMYRPYFGNIMTVTINGISIRFPVDGSKQEIPATFADEIERRRRNIDNILKKQKRMAAVTENEDKGSIGSLSLF